MPAMPKALLIACALLIASVISTQAEQPPPGKLVDIGGRSLHLYCRGEATPTVVIEAGARNWSLMWYDFVEKASRSMRICTYDRAGRGWSDDAPWPPSPRRWVADLESILIASGELPPYVLVGHTLGADVTRLLARQRPDLVAGIVLVEPIGPSVRRIFSLAVKGIVDAVGRDELNRIQVERLARLRRGELEDDTVANSLPENLRKELGPQLLRIVGPNDSKALRRAILNRSPYRLMRLRDTPLTVLVPNQIHESELLGVEIAAETHDRMIELRMSDARAVAASSNRSSIVVVNAKDGLQFSQPKAVIEALNDMIQTIRQGR